VEGQVDERRIQAATTTLRRIRAAIQPAGGEIP
jgi:hypothetical protein